MSKSCDLRLDEFFSRIYLPYASQRKKSWAVDERISRKHISPYFGHLRLRAISGQAVAEWFAGLAQKGLAAATCNRILAVLRGVFSLAGRLGFIDPLKSPCKPVMALRVHNTRTRALSEEEARRLMLELDRRGHPQAIALRLLLLTGARKNEILRARWENIDLERGILLVPVSKSGKPRQIVLSPAAIRLLKTVKRSGEWLFPGRNPKKPLSDVYRFWNTVRRSLGLADVRIHDLRHTYASILVKAGHTLYEAQKLLGHADPRTTMRYAHLDNDVLRKAAQTVSIMVSPQRGVMEKNRHGAAKCCQGEIYRAIIGCLDRLKRLFGQIGL